jgi:hypothetical protein
MGFGYDLWFKESQHGWKMDAEDGNLTYVQLHITLPLNGTIDVRHSLAQNTRVISVCISEVWNGYSRNFQQT